MQISLPGNGDFALSVTDAQLIKWDSLENNISTQLLMKSELRGHIESPNYYFTANTTQINEHLDLLMLTQGWKNTICHLSYRNMYLNPNIRWR